ncbi:MAG: ornithine cyclodeaminase family protein [Pseudomonadota bacterium]
MALYLGQSDLDTLFARGAVTPADCVDAVAASFAEQGREQVGVLPRQIVWAEPAQTAPRSRALKMSAAYMRESHLMGASIYAVQYTPGSVDMWLTVFSGETGQMLGVINSKQLSVWKTAATAAVAARALARPDAHRVALVGTGSYALAQLTFMAAVMPIDGVRCFSRNADALKAFCEHAQTVLGLPVTAAASVKDAVRDADVVTTITISPTPVLLGEWLPEGVHCNVMGQHAPTAREVDTAAVLQSRVIVDAMAQAMNEKGELLIPIDEGVMTKAHIAGELGAVLAGQCEGRSSVAQRTMFCSGGTAFEYMGLCGMLLEKAAAAGIGQQLRP